MPMRFGLKLAPQFTTVDELREVWRIADEAGFDHCWTFDHFASIRDRLDGDVYEGWMLLASMAEVTSRVRIGSMVGGNTYRHPAVLAKMATTLDHLSGGRLEFGIGAAWAEEEHQMLGLEFGTFRDRFDRLDEACQVIRSLWTEPRTTFDGTHYHLDDAIAEPKPVQRPYPPIWIGGRGRKRALRIVAKYADAWNATDGPTEEIAELSAVLDAHCAAVGRDPAAIRRTVQVRVDEQADDLLEKTEAFAGIGIDDIIVTMGVDQGNGAATAERVAGLLPRLRSIG